MPACRNTPAEAASNAYHTHFNSSCPAASEISDLLTKPDVMGKAEIASAPIMPQMQVSFIVR